MSWNFLPAKDRNPAPSAIAEAAEMSPAMHELARRKRAHKRAMTTLGKCLFAAAFSMEPQAVPVGKTIVSVDPLTLRASRPKATSARKAVDADLDLL